MGGLKSLAAVIALAESTCVDTYLCILQLYDYVCVYKYDNIYIYNIIYIHMYRIPCVCAPPLAIILLFST